MTILRKSLFNFCKKNTAVIFLIGVVFLFFWKIPVKGSVPFPGDFVVGIYHPWLDYKWGYDVGVPVKNPIVADVPSFMYPMQTFAAHLMKSGQWPLWNHHILGGIPLLANFQSAPFSPSVLFYFLLDDISAWTAQIVFSHIVAACGIYILLRKWHVSKMGSVVGGTVFAFSGYNLIWSQWNGHTISAAFIPFIIYCVSLYWEKHRVVPGVGISVFLAFQIFSGYPQTVLYTAVALAVFFAVNTKFSLQYIKKGFIVGFFCLLGFALAAIQLSPSIELLKQSQWLAEPNPYIWSFLPFEKTITFIAPDYFGNHVTGNYWGLQDYTSNTGYVGVVAFALASVVVFSKKKTMGMWYALTLLIATLIISYPTPLSVYLWKNNIAGLGASSSHRALVLLTFSFSLLAGFGFDSIKKMGLKKRVLSLVPVWILYVFFILYALLSVPQSVHSFPAPEIALKNMILPGLILASTSVIYMLRVRQILILLLILELFRFGWKFTPFTTREFVFPTTPVIEYLMKQNEPFRISASSVIPVNMRMPYGLESLEGYETMRPYLSSQFIASLNRNSENASPAGRYGMIDNDTSHLMSLVNSSYYMVLKKDLKNNPSQTGIIEKKYTTDQFTPVFEDKSVTILKNNAAMDRSFMVYDWEILPDNRSVLQAMLSPDMDYKNMVYIMEDPQISPQSPANATIRYTKYTPQASKIEVSTSKDGLLFTSDAYYPGWSAYIDGTKTKIHQANYAFRAIVVPQGDHTIEYRYEPKSFEDGLMITKFSLLLVSGLLLARKRLQSILG